MKIKYWLAIAAAALVVAGIAALPHVVRAYCPGGNGACNGHIST